VGLHLGDVVNTTLDIAALVDDLGLGDFETRDDLIRLLQERRGCQADALAARMPDEVPVARTVRLRATQRREIELCEQALSQLGAPFVAPNLNDEDA
jgi:hypothetical protein